VLCLGISLIGTYKSLALITRINTQGCKAVIPIDNLIYDGLCRELMDVWTELQDIHDAYGLRYQWGGSHSNKKLLCSLGIDTRNIVSLSVKLGF